MKPAIGQRWKDCDSNQGRELVIVAEGQTKAIHPTRFAFVCEVWKAGKFTGRTTTIAADRFRNTPSTYLYVGPTI